MVSDELLSFFKFKPEEKVKFKYNDYWIETSIAQIEIRPTQIRYRVNHILDTSLLEEDLEKIGG